MPRWLWHAALSLVYNVAPRVADVFTFILISRISGPYESGVFSVATAYLAIALAATRGLDDLLTREVARRDAASGPISRGIVGLLTMKVLVALISLGIVIFLVAVLDYAPYSARVARVMALAIVPDSVASALYAYMQGQRRFRVPTVVVGSISILRLGGASILLWRGGTVFHLAAVWAMTAWAGAVVAWFAVASELRDVCRFTMRDLTAMDLRRSLAFLAITGLLAVESYADVILLERLQGPAEVGWYRSATNIVFGLAILSQAYQVGVYPSMVRLMQTSEHRLMDLYISSLRWLLAVGLLFATLVWTLAPQLIIGVFGEAFGAAIPVLRILVVSLLFIYLSAPMSRMMLVQERQESVLLFLAISLALNILVNILLSGRMGARGSALARVTSSASFAILNGWYLRRLTGPPRLLGAFFRSGLGMLAAVFVVSVTREISVLGAALGGAIAFGVVLWILSRLSGVRGPVLVDILGWHGPNHPDNT